MGMGQGESGKKAASEVQNRVSGKYVCAEAFGAQQCCAPTGSRASGFLGAIEGLFKAVQNRVTRQVRLRRGIWGAAVLRPYRHRLPWRNRGLV